MHLVILTTQTSHHAYFVRELAHQASINLVVVETHAAAPKFATHHPFEEQRERYEQQAFFDGQPAPPLKSFAPVLETPSVNDPQCVHELAAAEPDLVFDFGTGKIAPRVIDLFPDRIVNLHGGDPERYRGLDSHLWAIYHREFDALVTTLHRLDPDFDRGDIILAGCVAIPVGAKLYQLRRFNTELCIKLALACIDMLRRHGTLITRPQRAAGRYYSFMPAVLKETCVRRFEHYYSDAPHGL